MPKGGSHTEGTNAVAGGRNAHAEGFDTSAGGIAAHAEGYQSTGSGDYSHAEGSATTASGQYSHVEGTSGIASGTASHVEGVNAYAVGYASHAQGNGAYANRYSQDSVAAGFFGTQGDAQASVLVLRQSTTNATPTLLTATGATTATLTTENTNVLTVPVNRAYRFRIDAVARRTDTPGEFAAWTINGTIVRSSSGDARFITTPMVEFDYDTAAAAWVLAVSVNNTNSTNNYLALTATGEAAKTIRWVARLQTVDLA